MFGLSLYELIAISVLTFLMFIIEVCTGLRVHRTLLNAVIILLSSGSVIVSYQAYRYYYEENNNVVVSSIALIIWFLSALFLGRHYYGLLRLAEAKNKKE